MANETRKISDVPELTRITDKTKLLVEEDGSARRISVDKLLELTDSITGTNYRLIIENGKLKMVEV